MQDMIEERMLFLTNSVRERGLHGLSLYTVNKENGNYRLLQRNYMNELDYLYLDTKKYNSTFHFLFLLPPFCHPPPPSQNSNN